MEKKRILEIKDLSVVYKTDEADVYAVNHIDFDLKEGETVGIVGETGAGKTTTALSIMRLLPEKIGMIENGEILLDGTDMVTAPSPLLRKICGEKVSMIFQDPMTSLNPVLPVGSQIGEVLELHRKELSKDEIEPHVIKMLEMVGISPDRKNDYPHQFSGGMKQRIVIAIALACQPKVLIADEPTTALDVTIQAQVLHMMKDLKDELGTSMILITHDLGIVAQTCDRVAIMYSGEIIEVGTVENIFNSSSHHPYTEGLFQSIPDIDKKEKRLHPIEGLMPDPTNLPSGCKFHPRCPYCMDKCVDKNPPTICLGGVHHIKCHKMQVCNS